MYEGLLSMTSDGFSMFLNSSSTAALRGCCSCAIASRRKFVAGGRKAGLSMPSRSRDRSHQETRSAPVHRSRSDVKEFRLMVLLLRIQPRGPRLWDRTQCERAHENKRNAIFNAGQALSAQGPETAKNSNGGSNARVPPCQDRPRPHRSSPGSSGI